ncbi:MAG: site-specific integrase [Lachnospiraceae bacterium]|nr:site-specific integrase [Lachnospiraceae bacterium]
MKHRKKRADGRYYANVVVGIDPKTGRYIRESIYGKTEEEVNLKEAKIKDALKKNTYSNDNGIVLKEYALYWIRRYKADPELEEHPELSTTYRDYMNIIKNHLGPMEQLPLMKIKQQNIMDSMELLNGHWDLQRRLKLTMNQILKSAMQEGLVYKNVADGIKLPKKPAAYQRKFTPEEEHATMLSLTDLSDKERLFVLLLFYTGCRRSELIPLTPGDIHMDKNYIDINKGASFPKNQALIGPTKSEAGVRKVEILEQIRPELQNYLENCESPYLFMGTSGRCMSLAIFRRMWNRIRNTVQDHFKRCYPDQEFDWDGYTPHRFRHNFCSMLHDAEVPAVDAQKIMGHSSINVTIDIYTHFDEEAAVQMGDRMNALIKTRAKQTAGPGPEATALPDLSSLDKEACLKLMQELTAALAEKM